MKFLDAHGVTTLWNKIKASFLPLNGGGSITVGDDTKYNIRIASSRSGQTNMAAIEIAPIDDSENRLFKVQATPSITSISCESQFSMGGQSTSGIVQVGSVLGVPAITLARTNAEGETNGEVLTLDHSGTNEYAAPITSEELDGVLV